MNLQTKLEQGESEFASGKYRQCESTLRSIVDSPDFGDQEPILQAKAFLKYGEILAKIDSNAEAESYLNKARDLYAETPGKRSLEYSEALKQIGLLYLELYKMDDAQPCLEEALDIRRELHKGGSLETASVLNELGHLFWRTGDNPKAIDYLTEAQKMQKDLGAEMTYDYANTLEYFGLVQMKAQDLVSAADNTRKCMEIRQAILPADHPTICYSLSNTATINHRMGIEEGNEDLLKKALAIAEPVYGEMSPRIGSLLTNLGGFYQVRGNLLEAEKYMDRALKVKEHSLGPNNEGLINCVNALAVIKKGLGKNREYEALRKRSTELMKAKLSTGRKKDIDTMLMLADKLQAQKLYSEAETVLVDALKEAVTEFGAESLKTAQVLSFIGLLKMNSVQIDNQLFAADAYDYARDCYAAALRIKKKLLGQSHAEVAEGLKNLAVCFMMQGMNDVSNMLNLQAQLIRAASGAADPSVAALEKTLQTRLDLKGPLDDSTISAMETLVHLHERRSEPDKADSYRSRILQSKEQKHGECSIELAQELSKQAGAHLPLRHGLLTLGDGEVDSLKVAVDPEPTAKALALSERAWNILEKIGLQVDSELTETTLLQMARCHIYLKNFDKAEALARESVEIRHKEFGETHHLFQSLTFLIATLKVAGKEGEAETVAERKKNLPVAAPEEQDALLKKLQAKMQKTLAGLMSGLAREINENDGVVDGAGAHTDAASNSDDSSAKKPGEVNKAG